ncbi:MAG: helix-turn-helix domain-containing protein [Ruminococcus flavefaciens]|nr:helix-turn-helix domain-containing protein [Ruminococcus flavefaciens]
MEKQIYMTPKQPFFVTLSESYSKCIVNQLGIVHFYQFRTGSEPQYVIPDGCVDMVFCCDPIRPYARICGTVLKSEMMMFRENSCYFGVRFLPGYNPVLEKSGIMKELVNNQIPFESLINDKRMTEGICSTDDFRMQISIFMRSYMSIYKRLSPLENSNLLVLHSANMIIRSAGRIAIEKIALETGYTERYIDKLFHNETGLSPKKFAEIVRFQNAVSALNEPLGHTLTEIAVNLEYFDQSHFVRDFKKYTGLTPKRYRTHLQEDNFIKKLNIIE